MVWSRHGGPGWAAIVLIAGFLAPSLAQAHDGHHHTAPAMAHASGDAGKPGAVTGNATTVVALHADDWASSLARPVSAGCDGHCCGGASGMTCCGAALAPDPSYVFAPPCSERFVFPHARALPGLAPEALPKPPKLLV